MDLMEAINNRKSIRAFASRPVPKDVVMDILEAACRAPSAMNTQPWEFIVITGEKLDLLRAQIIENLRSGSSIKPDHLVVGWPSESVYKERQIALAKQLFAAMDIPRGDKEKRGWWLERGFRFFDAPAAIIIAIDSSLNDSSPLLDIGAVMQNICLAALEFGLGTCIEDQGILYPEVVRRLTGIPDNKRFIIAIALGYPDPDFAANKIRSSREPAENLTVWVE